MRVIKPAWVEHKGEKKNKCPIYSISVHPDGTRLATGGLDRKVKIWSTLPILDEDAERDEANPKLLCTMSEHTGSVLAVRWAHHGRFLASGSDDQVVMIWGLDPDGGGRLWGSDEVNVENWKPLTRLVAHHADVVDIAWSRDDSMLASTGLDSTVWIWDGTTFERIRKIDQHQGFVKGVTWDPVGNFLATQSDDKTVKVWDVDTWELVSTISEPFKNSGHATFFRRLSWSPDGAFIAASNAKNGPVFVASVIDRDQWTHNISFVGHQNTIQVAAFNPRMFLSKGDPIGRMHASCVLALGADDFSISIWRNTLHKPFVVLHDIFGRNLLDMCWDNEGLRLYGCSEDGTICAISFEEPEFPDRQGWDTTQLILDEYEYKPKRKTTRTAPFAPSNNQVPQMNGFGAPTASMAGGHTGSGSTVNVLQPRKAKPGDTRRRVNLQRTNNSNGGGGGGQPPLRAPFGPPSTLNPPQQQLQQPGAFGGPLQPYTSASQADASTRGMMQDRHNAFAANGNGNGIGYGNAMFGGSDALPQFGESSRTATGRTMGVSSSTDIPIKEIRAPRSQPVSGSISGSSRHGGGRILPIPSIQTVLRAVSTEPSNNGAYFQAINTEDVKGKNKVIYSSGGQDVWLDYIPSAAVSVFVTERFAGVGLEDGSLLGYTLNGRCVLNVRLEGVVVEMSGSGNMLGVVTSDCLIRVHDTKNGRALFTPTSCAHLLDSRGSDTPEITIERLQVRPNGIPIILSSEPAAWAYDPTLQSWIPLISLWDLTIRPLNHVNSQRGFIADLETELASKYKKVDQVGGEKPQWWDIVTEMAYLERKLKGAILCEDLDGLRGGLARYIDILGKEGFVGRAEDLIKDFMSPIGSMSNRQGKIAGVPKRDLLRDILSVYSQSQSLQGLAEKYSVLLRVMYDEHE